MTDRIRCRVLVHGHVQGVGLRWATAEEAQRLGVSGRVQNRPDGTVEVIAEGERPDVQALLGWLRHGPPLARVDRLDIAEKDPVGEHGFRAS